MKRLVLAALILTTAVGASAQFTSTDTLKYRISLTDKAATTYSIQQGEFQPNAFDVAVQEVLVYEVTL